MASGDLMALLPLLVISAGAVAVLLFAAFRPGHRVAAGGAMVTLALAFASAILAKGAVPRRVTAILIMDRYALFYIGLFAVAALVVAALSYGFLEQREERREEYYVLLLLATLGSGVLAASSHFVSFFLGLELLSVSLYVLISYPSGGRISLEAGLKYLVLAGASSSFLLFGMALIYYRSGTMEFARVGALIAAGGASPAAPFLFGIGMILTGVGFKLGVVPFHMWTPDVYEGAPAPVTAFVATVSKGAMFALLFRYFLEGRVYAFPSVRLAIATVAVLSMLAGNLLALHQDNVKRILAYSSIAHLGYLLVALLAGGVLAGEAVTFYLVAYFVTTLGAFGVVTVLSGSARDAGDIGDYKGLFWRRPWLAGIFSACLFSLAGIPLTAGFVGKFYILAAGVRNGIWVPVAVLVASSAIGLFYYLRVVVAMYSRAPDRAEGRYATPALSVTGGVVLAGLALVLVWLGVYPAPAMQLIREVLAGLATGL